MFAKLLNKLPFWRKLDETLLLRYPRIWQTRIHAAVLFMLMAYPLVFLFGAIVVRLLITFAIGNLTSGTVSGKEADIALYLPQVKLSYALDQAVKDGQNAGQFILLVSGFVLLIIGILFWLAILRGQRKYSIEQVYGKRSQKSTWLEWMCYALSGAIFAGMPLFLMLSASPLPMQIQTAQKVNEQTKINALKFAAEYGVDVSKYKNEDGSLRIGPIIMIGDPTNPYITYSSSRTYANCAVYQMALLADAEFAPEVHLSPHKLPSTGAPSDTTTDWQMDISKDPELQAYVSDLRAYAYTNIFAPVTPANKTSSISTEGISFFRTILFWWLMGFPTLIIFMSKRELGRAVSITLAICVFVMPILMLLVAALLNVLIFAIAGILFGRSSYPENASEIIFSGSVLMPYLILFALSLVGTLLAAYGAKTYRRSLRTAVSAFPVWIGFLPLIGLLTASSLVSTSAYRNYDLQRKLPGLIPLALAVIPFMHLPFLPLIDRAATRLMSLPKDK